jgi:hypothetical protein
VSLCPQDFFCPFCRYRPVQADAGLPAWSSLPTELEFSCYARHHVFKKNNYSARNRVFGEKKSAALLKKKSKKVKETK